MKRSARVRDVVCATVGVMAVMTSGPVMGQSSPAASTSQPAKGVVIRGCLNGEKLSRIEPQNVTPAVELALPDVLRVTTIKVIKDQVKALNGHQVEVTGALRGVPGVENGIVVAEGDNGKLIIGGNQDPAVSKKDPPGIHATLIKDIAATCPGQPAKSK